ncbi:MAG TPA: GNAT family N-acetyltransferase [Candidatus Limnocylindrales bacterium]|nr:GNAT family N-acetyltransferase [Candidatus Limnocylindrales bacterium]
MKDVAAIQRLLYPAWVKSEAGWRHNMTTMPERARDRFVVVCVDGKVVGFAWAFLNYQSEEEGSASLRLNVLPDHRGRGIGSALYADASRHFETLSVLVIRSWVPDEPASNRFAQRHGFERRREMRYSSLDPRDLPPMPEIPEGVTLSDWDTGGIDAIYDWDVSCMFDEPSDFPAAEATPKDEWIRQYWLDPDHRRDLGVVAMADGMVVAGTAVEADGTRSVSGFTGVRPGYRGRGLAKLVKSASLRRVAAAGITQVYTSNDGANAAMLAVNEWLGYRPVSVQIQWRHVSKTWLAHSSPL